MRLRLNEQDKHKAMGRGYQISYSWRGLNLLLTRLSGNIFFTEDNEMVRVSKRGLRWFKEDERQQVLSRNPNYRRIYEIRERDRLRKERLMGAI